MRPLVSICVKCHNQAQTIGAALKAALAQSHRPLEVVVGDDASTDDSWTVIGRTLADRPADPALSVVAFRNATNLGNLGNWMELCAHAHGEWLVKADGDDVSLPERVSRIVDEIEANPSAVALMHAVHRVVDGRRMGQRHPGSPVSPLGAGMAFARICYDAFPAQVMDGRIMDDEVFARRARMLGETILLDEPLVDYSAGGVSFDAEDILSAELRCTRLQPKAVEQALIDLEAIRGRLGDARVIELKELFCKEVDEAQLRIDLMSSPCFAKRLNAWWHMQRPPVWRPGWWKYVLYLLPRPISSALLAKLIRLRRHLP